MSQYANMPRYMTLNSKIHMRDPIHGTIPISYRERELIDSPLFQRLRNIRQLGFADQAFPSANHKRYSHSIGAMHLATRIFDTVVKHLNLPKDFETKIKKALRLGMLFHDIGHAPLSHTTEMIMPLVKELGLDKSLWDQDSESFNRRQATHEDYTLKILSDSDLSEQIDKFYKPIGISGLLIAQLLKERNQELFVCESDGFDYTPLLRQIISSECDADRMDYLERDSFYCGVNYGKIDKEWLINNFVPIKQKNRYYLGLHARAIYSFEDFLLSRYHMFATVYHHYTPCIFEKMLKVFFEEEAKTENKNKFKLPANLDDYIRLDDISIWSALRASESKWAKRITQRKPYYLLFEQDAMYPGGQKNFDFKGLEKELKEQNIDFISSKAKSSLSKYFGKDSEPLYILRTDSSVTPLEQYTPLFERYRKPSERLRLYVLPDQYKEAREILKRIK